MKKLILTSVLVALASLANAANFQSQDFLSVQAVYATNTVQITNLLASGSVGTNVSGTTYTNNGSRVVVTAAGAGASVNLLKDVSLWARADGSPPTTIWSATNGAALAAGSYFENSDVHMSVTYSSGSGANAAVTFTIVPIPDGEHASEVNPWSWSFTAVASSTLATVRTNVPISSFTGCKGLRLLRIVNADTDASSQVIITDARINGFVP